MKTINSLEKMEKIVSQSKFLFWEGWNVVEMIKSDKALTSKYGVLKNNSWYLQKTFTLSRNGWEIPDKYVR
jgi:hypothetical protein